MAIEVFNRIEKKYLMDEATCQELTARLTEYMEVDEYNREHKFYSIANIYYDTPSDELIRKSLEKPAYKEKLRLRSYGVPGLEDKVYLEIKKKYAGIVNKRRTSLVLSEAYQYVNEGIRPERKPYINTQVLNEIDAFQQRYRLEPKVYLAYDRRAYFGKEDKEFRVTFDTNIRTRREHVRLEYGSEGTPLLEKGIWLMEVKILGATPLWFTNLLSEYKLYGTSFSKYGTEYKKYLFNHNMLKGEEILCLNQLLRQPVRHHYQLAQQF